MNLAMGFSVTVVHCPLIGFIGICVSKLCRILLSTNVKKLRTVCTQWLFQISGIIPKQDVWQVLKEKFALDLLIRPNFLIFSKISMNL